MTDIWVLGAARRSGRAVAAGLAARQASLVLVGRDGAALRDLAAQIGATPRILAVNSLDAIKAELAQAGPVVVANFIGPFAQTALPIVRACAPGSHYLDLSNELPAAIDILDLQDEAVAAGRCLVTGAGYGVLATESIVLKLCETRAPAVKVRVDAAPFVDSSGFIGLTLAATIIEGFPAGGRRYEGGRLVRAGLGSEFQRFVAPDGTTIATGAVPTGDLEAARRASGAQAATAASSFAPSSPLVRALMAAVSALFSLRPVREFATRRLARVEVPPAKGPPKNSWTHARVEWFDGTHREGWMRTGDAMDFTVRAASEVAFRLARNEGRPGAFTPGALFGRKLAVEAGGEFMID
jgi:short subunit dehydrogenase-like uncharacterized protein